MISLCIMVDVCCEHQLYSVNLCCLCVVTIVCCELMICCDLMLWSSIIQWQMFVLFGCLICSICFCVMTDVLLKLQ